MHFTILTFFRDQYHRHFHNSFVLSKLKKDADLMIGMKDSVYRRFGASGLEKWVRTKTVTFKN